MKRILACVVLFLLLSCYERDNPVDPGATNWVPPASQVGITTQPQSQEIAIGQSVTFSIVASGNPTEYQWKKEGRDIGGAVYASYTMNAVQRGDSGGYIVVVGGNGMSVESDTAVLKVMYAPVIAAQPINQTKPVGAACTLSVAVSGFPQPSYQWAKNGQSISGAILPFYLIKAVQRSDSGSYSVVANNSQGSVTSSSAILTAYYAPAIMVQPQARTKASGAACTLSVVAAGCPQPTFQWSKNGTTIPGATQPTYSIGSLQRSDSGTYTVVATNSQGNVVSAAALLLVDYVSVVVQPQPQLQTKNTGDSVSFSVSAIGYPSTLNYQWARNTVNIAGATKSTFSIASVQRGDSGSYTVALSNGSASATSAGALLVVNYAPVITTQPQSQAIAVGKICSLFVVAAAHPSPSYQWEKNGTAISGATAGAYTIAQAQPGDTGLYACVVTNAMDSAVSGYAKLTISTYTVSFNSNGGGAVDSQKVFCNSTATSPAAPGKTGYTFSGWYADSGLVSAFGFSTPITSSITLYAKWTIIPTFTVMYNGNLNNLGTAPIDTSRYPQGAIVTILGQGILIKYGAIFTGWNTQMNGTGVSYNVGATFAIGAANVALYAQWIQTYAVSYNPNGNTDGVTPLDTNSYQQGATVTVLGSGTLVKTGFTFTGWNTYANGTGTSYAPGATFVMGNVIVSLFAQWQPLPTYSVSYLGNANTGGTVPLDINKYLPGSTVTVRPNSGNLTKTGYTFTGWNTAGDGTGTGYPPGATFAMGSSNDSLFVSWTAIATYSVTYNGNSNSSGTVPVDANNYTPGSTVTVLANTGSLVKTGYTFSGWNTTADGSGISYSAGGTFPCPSAYVILYAQWL